MVLHPDDVSRVDLRHDFITLWVRSWHRHTGAIFVLVAAVIASAVVPTVIAGRMFVPQQLLPRGEKQGKGRTQINGLSEEG